MDPRFRGDDGYIGLARKAKHRPNPSRFYRAAVHAPFSIAALAKTVARFRGQAVGATALCLPPELHTPNPNPP